MLCRVSFFQDLLSRKVFSLAPVMKYVFTKPTDVIAFLLGVERLSSICYVMYSITFSKKNLVIIQILSIKSNNPIRITYEIWLRYISGLSSIFSSILSSICLSSTGIFSSIYYVSSIIFPSYLHNSLIKSQHRSILSSIYYP